METYAIIPTMPGREDVLVKAAQSLAPQVDALFIYLNNIETLPKSIAHIPNLEIVIGPDRGSAARFYLGKKAKGYLAFCDDDLEYYENYIRDMKAKVDQYGRKCVITMHGRVTNPQMYSFQGLGPGRCRKCYPCLGYNPKDVEVHMAGTGAMMYHTDTLQLTEDDFKNNNLDDAEFSILCQQRSVPIICVAHNTGMLTYLNPKGWTIWEETMKDPLPLLRLINSHQWEFFTNEHD